MSESKTPKKEVGVLLPLIVGIAIALGMFIGKQLNPNLTNASLATVGPTKRNTGKVEEILRYINARYVEDVSSNDLSDQAIRAIMSDLDPHSTYHSAKDISQMSESLRGNFDGIGVEFTILDDTIAVLHVMDDGPSKKVGLQPLDRIIEVEDSLVAGIGITSNQVIGKLKGPEGTTVNIKVLRKGQSMDFSIQRGRVLTTSIDAAIMIGDRTGYIKLDNFSATTYADFMKGMEGLIENHGMEDLIIDLRGNPGGYMQQAVRILDQFFQEKERVLVYTQGDKSKKYEYKTSGRNFYDVGNIAVLIDEGSASASEIIAGAIQDWDRGIIVGRRSYGKGLVQEQYPLKDGSAIRLTIARYYTPAGRCIQKAYNDTTDYGNELYNRYSNGELYTSDKVRLGDTTKYQTAGGRIVFAGGGISPDVFVPLDTTKFNAAFYAMRGPMNDDVIRYFESEPSLANMDIATFKERFAVPEQRIRNIFERQFPKPSERIFSYASLAEAAQYYYKARLGRQIFGDNGFYEIWTQEDESIDLALRALENPKKILAP